MSVTATSKPASYVTLPRETLLEAIAHVEGTRFDYPGHRLAPTLRKYAAAPTIAHATDTTRPLTDQATLARVLRSVAEYVHVGELEPHAARVIVGAVLPHVTDDQWTELVEAYGTYLDLDTAVMHWQQFNPRLPAQNEHRQAVATDIAERDAELLIFAALNPGERACADCVGSAERLGAALPGKTVCGTHLHRRGQRVDAMRARDAAQRQDGDA